MWTGTQFSSTVMLKLRGKTLKRSCCHSVKSIYLQSQSSTNSNLHTAFCNKRKEFRRCIEDKMRSHFEDSGDNSIIMKKLWSLVKSASNSSRIPEMVSYKGKFRNNPTDQANLFNYEFFCDQFSEISDYD